MARSTSVDGQPTAGVIPRGNTKRRFHEPAGAIFERAADHRRSAENQERIRLPQAIQAHGYQYRTTAVNRRERAPQQTSAVLKFTVIQRHMVDRLHNQATHRSDGKQPEDIEKVQRNIALAGLVAA